MNDEAMNVKLWIMNEMGRIRATKKFVLGSIAGKSLTILVEEVGEVAKALLEHGPVSTQLIEELVQVAAVSQLWLEFLYMEGKRVKHDSANSGVKTEAYHNSAGGTVGERREGDGGGGVGR